MKPVRLVLLACLVMFTMSLCQADDKPVSFKKDVLPILTASCMECHGPEAKKRKANLRFDTELAYTDPTLFVPGNSKKGDFMGRIVTKNARQVMPPPNYKSQLTQEQIELLKKWINEGVKFEKP
jgi:mono/diheme cytochrome c family protein